MQMWVMMVFMALLMNIPAMLPALFLKVDKKIKIAITIRVYILCFFLIMTLITLTSSLVDKHASNPLWLSIASAVFFFIALKNCAQYMRKCTSKLQRRSVILFSFFIIYAIRFNSLFINTGAGYETTSFGIVFSALFIFACVLAYLATSSAQYSAGAGTASFDGTSQPRVDKSYAPQSDINYDIHMKGKDVLNDPNLSVIEQQRYRDALQKKEDESGW
ncbi:hypothetical protein [Erwinia sp.]|uniref:hypothetical protein n=1 Tax=Erwinia citreus TaxID=558 RepID=UPI00289AAA41|nr:hypothetical protein [Erwinia sp.]